MAREEAEAIRACASSTALPESVTMVAGAGEGGRITVTRAVACFMKVVQAMADEDEEPAAARARTCSGPGSMRR